MGWRSIFGLVAGVVAGWAVIVALEMLGHALFPLADETARVEDLPMAMKLSVVAIYLVASFIGGAVAARVGRTSLPSFGVGGVLLGMGILSATMIHQPSWMVIANCLALFLPAVIAGRIFAKAAARPAPSAQGELPLRH